MADRVTKDITTGVGILSFPHLFKAQAEQNKNDKGEPIYDCQFLVPKSDRDAVRALLRAVKEVGVAKWGDPGYKNVRQPVRDGDREKDQPTEDGSTKGEKYPERLGHIFINCRSKKPVAVLDRQRSPIDAEDVYSGCKVKVAVTIYPYAVSGNSGIGIALNGVQKVSDGEPIGGGGKPSIEAMFEEIDDDEFDDDLGVDEADDPEPEPEPEPKPAKKAAAKKSAAKKAAAKPEPEPEVEVEVDADEGDLLDDLDDLDD